VGVAPDIPTLHAAVHREFLLVERAVHRHLAG
jgi:hypothetical protein